MIENICKLTVKFDEEVIQAIPELTSGDTVELIFNLIGSNRVELDGAASAKVGLMNVNTKEITLWEASYTDMQVTVTINPLTLPCGDYKTRVMVYDLIGNRISTVPINVRIV